MSTVTPRRMLIVQIQKKLSDLSHSQLRDVAHSIADPETATEGLSEPELYDEIVDYVRSEKLKEEEDEGMSQLLSLNDLIGEMLPTQATDSAGVTQAAPLPTGGDLPTHPTSTDRDIATHPTTMDRGIHTNTFMEGKAKASSTPSGTLPTPETAKSGRHSGGGAPLDLSSTVTGPVVRLSDVATLLPRREFKLYGGQLSDAGSEISYGSLNKQIDEGLRDGFSESEIIRTVLRITKPGVFREMLSNQDDLTVEGLKRFLRSHIRDKNVTELYQELSNARQHDKETPQQFLYRVMGLKQRVLFESRQPGAGFSYDEKLVQGTFLHTLYQGLNEKNSHVRRDLKPFFSDMLVSDDFLLEQITKSTSEEDERLKRLGTPAKTRPVTASAAQHNSNEQIKPTEIDSELQANRAAISELTAQVSALTQRLAQMAKPTENATPGGPANTMTHPQPPVTESRGMCNDCVQKGSVNCPHCFICGQAGHRAVGCLQKRTPGNGGRSSERGTQ